MKLSIASLSLLIFLLISACGSRKEILADSLYPGTYFGSVPSDTVKRDTFVFLLQNPAKSSAYGGPIKVVFKMETAKINGKVYNFYQTREFMLTNESDFIHFDNAIGIKFFRISNTEMGQLKNYFKYQIYIFDKGYWRESSNDEEMRELNISNRRHSNLSTEDTKVSSTSDHLNYAFSYSFLMP